MTLITDPEGCFCTKQTTPVHIMLKNAAPPDYLAEIQGVTDRDVAALWTGTILTIPRNRLPAPTEPDGLLLHDRIGMTVQNVDGLLIGTVLAIQNFGASDLLEIKPETGKSFYLPITPDFIIDTDVTAGHITITNYDVFM